MPRTDPTLAHLLQRRPDRVFQSIPDIDVPAGRTPVMRRSWAVGPLPANVDLALVVREQSLPDAEFYLDTCFVTDSELDQQIWSSLLQRTIVITPGVRRELEPWINDPKVNCQFRDLLVEAEQVGHPAIRFDPPADQDNRLEYAAKCYVELLGIRKRAWAFACDRVRSKSSKDEEPTGSKIRETLQKMVGARGLTLAEKGRDTLGSPNFYTDEELVVRSAIRAISSARETTVLTRDSDLVEQFYKLLYLIDTHYLGYLIGEAYRTQPLNFPTRELALESELLQNHYASGELLSLPDRLEEAVLPRRWAMANCHVCRIPPERSGGEGQLLAFCAEAEMLPMLHAKGTTRGKNTDAFGSRNVHRCVTPDGQDAFGGYAVITQDRCFDVDDVSLPLVDIHLALRPTERINHAEVPVESSEAGKVAGEAQQLACTRLQERLSFGELRCKLQDSNQLGLAIGLLPPGTRVYVDPSFARAPFGNDISDILKRRGCVTSRNTFDDVSSLLEPRPKSLSYILNAKRAPGWLEVFSEEQLPSNIEQGANFYMSLLAYRKQFGDIVRQQLSRGGSNKPSRDALLEYLDSIRGDHRSRAIDAADNANNPRYFDEDELLVQAVVRSLFAGHDNVVLTNRPIVLAQFRTLVAVLLSHYRLRALAPGLPVPPKRRRSQRRSTLADKELGFLGRALRMPIEAGDLDRGLPPNALPVHLACWCAKMEGDRIDVRAGFARAEIPCRDLVCEIGVRSGFPTHRFGDRTALLHFRGDSLGSPPAGQVTVGHPIWDRIGSRCLPRDHRIRWKTGRIPRPELVNVVNFCD